MLRTARFSMATTALVSGFVACTASAARAQVPTVAPGNSPPAAQPAPPASGAGAQVGEIVVTANKRSENIQKAPVAITALNAASLQALGVHDVRGLQQAVPGAEIRPEGAVSRVFFRGVGNNVDEPNTEPAITTNLNGIPLPRYATTSAFYDLQQVEALPGPQGTLYGGSAAGGVINLQSKQPGRTYAGEGSIEGGTYGLAHVTAAQDVPVTSDLSLRGAVDYGRHDGYESRGFDSDDKIAGRLTMVWKPVSDLKVTIFGAGFRDTGNPPATVNSPLLNPSNPWFVPTVAPLSGAPIDLNSYRKDYNNIVVGGQIDYTFDGLTFSYIPGFARVYDNSIDPDADIAFAILDAESQFTQELRLSNAQSSRFQWQVGLYYYYDRIIFDGSIGPFDDISTNPQFTRAYAGYTQGIYRVTNRVRLTVGGRVSYNSKDVTGIGTNIPFTADHNETRGDYKVGVDADLTSRSLVYATVQTGYLPAGYTPLPNTATFSNYVRPETLMSYTAGIKNRLFNNSLTLNDEFFYYDYKNFQAVGNNLDTGVQTLVNAPKARIYGDQLDATWVVTKNDRLNLGLSLLSARFTSFDLPGLKDFTGYQLGDAPIATLDLGGEHDWDFATGAQLGFAIQSHIESGYWGQYDHTSGTHQDAYTRTDLNLIYRAPNRNWDARLWVRNVEDAAVFGSTASGGQPGPASVFLDPPRTFGVTLSRRWD